MPVSARLRRVSRPRPDLHKCFHLPAAPGRPARHLCFLLDPPSQSMFHGQGRPRTPGRCRELGPRQPALALGHRGQPSPTCFARQGRAGYPSSPSSEPPPLDQSQPALSFGLPHPEQQLPRPASSLAAHRCMAQRLAGSHLSRLDLAPCTKPRALTRPVAPAERPSRTTRRWSDRTNLQNNG